MKKQLIELILFLFLVSPLTTARVSEEFVDYLASKLMFEDPKKKGKMISS